MLLGAQRVGAQVVQVDAQQDEWPCHAGEIVVQEAHEQMNRVDLVVTQRTRLLLCVLEDPPASTHGIGVGMQRFTEGRGIHPDGAQWLSNMAGVDEPPEHVGRAGRGIDHGGRSRGQQRCTGSPLCHQSPYLPAAARPSSRNACSASARSSQGTGPSARIIVCSCPLPASSTTSAGRARSIASRIADLLSNTIS